MVVGRIHITEPNGVKRSKPVSTRGLCIGRGEENDFIINYGAVSRRHAQIDCDGFHFYVTDLETDNGTYLGSERIPANAPTVWQAGVPLYIGDVVLELEQMQSASGRSAAFAGAAAEKLHDGSDADRAGGAGRWILISLAAAAVLTAIVLAAYYLAFYQ